MVAAASRGWMQQGLIRGNMLGKTMLPGDEELGKKDDDFPFRPRSRLAPVRPHTSRSWGLGHVLRWRRRRLLLIVAGLLAVYLLLGREEYDSNPRQGVGDDLFAHSQSSKPFAYRPPTHSSNTPGGDGEGEPIGPPPGTSQSKHGAATPRIYDGQVRFFRLAGTLRESASHMGGYEKRNRNVVFAMSSLASAAMLLPLLCDMAKWRRNHVHAALMGRIDIPLHHLLEINGVDQAACPVVWHDARPDYTEYSTDTRAERAVIGAMSHINSFLHPQAIIVGDASSEDEPLMRGMRTKTSSLNLALIEIPKDSSEALAWMTRLDSGSLRQWHMPNVDILIQVPPQSSNVLRLLKSIKEADYGGLSMPRIIIELPADLDESVRQHITNFRWPPDGDQSDTASKLIVRRRLASRQATQEESTIKFLELFYPTSIARSHALVLSTQAQLAPQYFQFVRHALLEYKYSSFGTDDNEQLMGVSLQLPHVLLDGKTNLSPPSLADMHTQRYKELFPETQSAPFLWQAPSHHAILFFGDKWVEWHSFVNNYVAKCQQNSKFAARVKEVVPSTLPSWTGYLLELMRARGYSILYPAVTGNTLATVHNELYYTPEELASSEPEVPEDAATSVVQEANTLKMPQVPEVPVFSSSTPLHLALPFDGDLPEVPHLPCLLYDGTKINPTLVSHNAAEYADEFRKTVGGCRVPKGKHRKQVKGETRDLFCFGDEDSDDWIDDGTSGAVAAAETVEDEGMGVTLPATQVLTVASRQTSVPSTIV